MGSMEHLPAVAPGSAARSDIRGPASGEGEYLTFRLGDEEYGIDILKVQEIRGYERPTRIANAPDYIKGVINLRGVIVPIVDLRMKLHLTDVDYDVLTVVIVLNIARQVVGVVVDSVSDVLELDAAHIKPAPEFGAAEESGFITGIGAVRQGDQERMLILADIEKMLSGTDLGLVAQEAH